MKKNIIAKELDRIARSLVAREPAPVHCDFADDIREVIIGVNKTLDNVAQWEAFCKSKDGQVYEREALDDILESKKVAKQLLEQLKKSLDLATRLQNILGN